MRRLWASRRRVLAAGCAALVLPTARPLLAQSGSRIPRLGMLFHAAVTPEELTVQPTIVRLRELGWVENRTLTIEYGLADTDAERLPVLAKSLIREFPDVIWADGFVAANAAARLTSTVPIVFWGVPRPVEQGLIDSLARPGRNVTGVASTPGWGTGGKRLLLLRDIAPRARRLAWILTPDIEQYVDGKYDLSPYEIDSRKAGFDPVIYQVHRREDIDKVLKAILARPTEVLSVGDSPVLDALRHRIASFATSNRLPSAYFSAAVVEAGGLISFGADYAQTKRTSAEYIDRILRGANPATMPVEQPRKFITVLNAGTAKALKLSIPQSVLAQVDRVIQ